MNEKKDEEKQRAQTRIGSNELDDSVSVLFSLERIFLFFFVRFIHVMSRVASATSFNNRDSITL